MSMYIQEKADSYCIYDLDISRNRKSRRIQVRHQQECIESLKKWFENSNPPRGTIVALPTGSGKTFTAIRFLCENPLSRGYKLLWMAHTHHLLEQAYFSFGPGKMVKDAEYEVGHISNNSEKLNLRLVSGSSKHQDISDIKETDDVIISTLQTISGAYKNKNSFLEKFLESTDGKLIVIFDEAHHSPAPTYRKLLIGDDSDDVRESLRERFPEMFILGLTATPTYTDPKKRGWLKDIFPQEIVYQAEAKELIMEKILSEPQIIELKTKFDPQLDNHEYQMLANRYGRDLPVKIIKRLALNKERNQLIASSYDKKKHGKTIIFTDYIDQCEQLNEYLQNQNKDLKDKIRSDVMYTRTDGDRNAEVLEKFRNGELDVVTNIRMLTEGTDIPDVDTVFLTRQTTSNILLTQMIGRALRGPRFGGTEKANLVFFIDNWRKAINWSKWDSRSWTAHGKYDIENGYKPVDYIPIRLIQELIKNMGDSGKNGAEFSTFLPVGWYQVNFYGHDISDNEDSDEVQCIKDFVLVFQNDRKNFKKFIAAINKMDIEEFDDDQNDYESCEERLKKWQDEFFDYDTHIGDGLLKDLFLLTSHVAQNEKNPKYFVFEERNDYDMDDLARRYMIYSRDEEDSNLRFLYENDDLLWNTLYPEYEQFKAQYNACVEYLLSIDGDESGKIVPTNEEKMLKQIKESKSTDKIIALNKLGIMGSEEYLHDETIEIIRKISLNKDEDESVRNAAKRAFKIIIRPLISEERENIIRRDGSQCLCCGENNRSILQVDHIIPRNRGGSNDKDNLQTLCKYCNSQKGTQVMNFRKNTTELTHQPEKNVKLNRIKYMGPDEIENSELWKKIIKRNINFFFECSAVADVHISKSGYNKNSWEVSIFNDNPRSWVDEYVLEMNNEINQIFQEYKMIAPRLVIVRSYNKKNIYPVEYEKLWKTYCNHPKRLNDEDKDRLAGYIKEYGYINN